MTTCMKCSTAAGVQRLAENPNSSSSRPVAEVTFHFIVLAEITEFCPTAASAKSLQNIEINPEGGIYKTDLLVVFVLVF